MKPEREHATNNEQTYFVTASTWERREFFRNQQWAELFFETLKSYRGKGYLLHEYVLMLDHFHALITPTVTLERAVQFIKGGFSYRVKKELGSPMEIWQRGFSDHRIRDREDYDIHVEYIYRNPVGKKFVERASDYPYCSAFPGSVKDEVPQWLKPLEEILVGTAEAVPFQSKSGNFSGMAEAVPFQSRSGNSSGTAEVVPVQSKLGNSIGTAGVARFPGKSGNSGGMAEAVPCQNKSCVISQQ